MPFELEKTSIEEVKIVIPKVFDDNRGFFLESYKKSDFLSLGINDDFEQDNHSKSSFGVLRGLHYQTKTNVQAKLVRCISGKIYDVALDLRKNSPTFGKWTGAILSADNKKMLYIPKGFAHGFLTLSEYAEVMYKVSGKYSPVDERGVFWNDSQIGVDWSNYLKDSEPILSEKDENQPKLEEISEEDLL